ncbi:hypothetical protein [Flavobacterium notoginsengisoli]|uniref:hypothetical protein n=1 Tax=Flavobacterium notoginsengisoli TaxID=1478199 RepID=UPI00362E245E
MKKDKHKEKAEKKNKKKKQDQLITEKPEEEGKKRETAKKGIRQRNPLIELDRGGNIFTNFFSNFFRQLRNPTNTGASRLLAKMLTVKIDEKDKKDAEKPLKPVDIMGQVKTVLRHVNNSNSDNISPAEKESLRQRTNQPLRHESRPEMNEPEQENKQRKNRLKM